MWWRGRTQVGLRGRQFQPPRQWRLSMHPLIVRICDWWRGRQLGVALAYGQTPRGEDPRTHVDEEIDAQIQRAQARLRDGYARAIAATEQAEHDGREREAVDDFRLRTQRQTERDLADEEEQLAGRTGPNRLQLSGTLTLLFLLTLPVDVGAAQLLPLTSSMQTLLVLTLGGGMVASADMASRKIEDLRKAYEKRIEDAFGLAQEGTLLTVAVGTPLGVVFGTTLLRAKAFGIAAKASGGTVPLGPANFAFAAIALMAFVVAILVALAYRHVKPLRDVRRKRRRLERKRTVLEAAFAGDGSLWRQAEVHQRALKDRCEQAMQALEHWGTERKARIRGHAAIVEARIRRRRRLRPAESEES